VSQPKRSDPFAERYGEFAERLRGDRWQPDVDVLETDDQLVVRADLAGVRSSDLRVTVDGAVLRISGVREAHADSEVRRLHQMEIASGPFERRVRIPVPFERDEVSAHLAEGFLTVVLRKRAPAQHSVTVETE
jgi:HSP20 family protein